MFVQLLLSQPLPVGLRCFHVVTDPMLSVHVETDREDDSWRFGDRQENKFAETARSAVDDTDHLAQRHVFLHFFRDDHRLQICLSLNRLTYAFLHQGAEQRADHSLCVPLHSALV